MQVAVFAALTAHPDMVSAFGGAPRIYDRVPADSSGRVTAKFPYCSIGEDLVIGQTNQNTDVSEVMVKVEVWSRAVGRGEVKLIAGAVRTALDTPLELQGHSVDTHTFHTVLYRREPDGLTERAIVEIRYQTSPGISPPYTAA
jgi:hypothetical protein